ncbi:MAG: GNAT family N-acetyltransferase [Oscillospiraceae bacterium]|nr:GNAT family N-acetyltransferase [Oscillospiraceae bacterium]
MDYYLSLPTLLDEEAATAALAAWRAAGGRVNPGLLRRYDGDYRRWLDRLAACRTDPGAGEVPQTFYFMKDASGRIVGAASLRHYLDGSNIIDGGHVAYGIAPMSRGQGLGNEVLRLALRQLRTMGIARVLVTCDADNIPSQRVILYNGGVLENEAVDEDGAPICRYWIGNA